jgi:hypothetical protein
MKYVRWKVMLRRNGRADRRYAATVKAKQLPEFGQEIIVRDVDNAQVTARIVSFEQTTWPRSRFEIYRVDADQIETGR